MISKKDIQSLADLARIEIEESEAESLATEVDSILGYVSQITNMNTSGSETVVPLRNVFREDVVTHKPNEYTEDILSNSPSREGNMLKVKKIL